MIDSDIAKYKKTSTTDEIYDNIFIAGHKGLVGSSVFNLLKKRF